MGDLVALQQNHDSVSTTEDSGIGGASARSQRKRVLIPGHHTGLDGETIEVSNSHFAKSVLTSLPPWAFYRRGGIPGELAGHVGEQRFRSYSRDRARLMIDKYVALVKRTGKGEHRDQVVPCTKDHAGLVLAAAETHYAVRNLKLLVPYPVYGCQPGWNDSGIYFDAINRLLDLKPIMDLQEIRETLEDLLIDFPFRDEASRQNLIGLLLTPIIRPLIQGNVPFHLVTSPMERTGKTLLVEAVVGGVLLGRPTPALQFSSNEEERDKRITSLLLQSDSIIHLDNLREHLDSAALASLLTSSTWQARLLGLNRVVELPNHAIFIGTGNNVQMSSELAKRTVPILLQPATDAPEDRTDFTHKKLYEYVISRRKHILECLLGMIALCEAAGRPRGKTRLGGFEDWVEMIGGVMAVCGYSRWLTNRREWLQVADRDGSDLRQFVEAWFERFRSEPTPAASLLDLADKLGLMQNVIRGRGESQRRQSFSQRVLSAHRDRPVGQFFIRYERTSQGGVWSLQSNATTEVKS